MLIKEEHLRNWEAIKLVRRQHEDAHNVRWKTLDVMAELYKVRVRLCMFALV